MSSWRNIINFKFNRHLLIFIFIYPFIRQKFEHAALLVNVCLTTCCAVIHVLYVAYHERMPVISVLESRSEYVL